MTDIKNPIKNTMTKEEMIDSLDMKYYALTDGCYIISDEFNNLVLCHRCDKDNPMIIDLDGEDLYIKYMQGNISYLTGFATGVRYVLFERLNNIDKLKCYKFSRIFPLIGA